MFSEFLKQESGKEFVEIIRKVKDKIHWAAVSENKLITWEIMKANPDLGWSMYGSSLNPNITWEIVRENINLNWEWDLLSCHKNIQPETVVNDFENVNALYLSHNPNLTPEFIEKHHLNWDWNAFLQNKNFTLEFIEKHLNKFGQWMLGKSRQVTWEFIEKNSFRFNSASVSLNSNINWDIVLANPKYDWDLEHLVGKLPINKVKDKIKIPKREMLVTNPDTQFEDIDKNWNWNFISKNPNVNWEIILSNLGENWNWYTISKISKIGEKFEIKTFRKWNSILKIQRWWRKMKRESVF